ncbi:MAG: DUF523 domain-containing protein [Bacilli bacterium]|jgi:uncharacterized protein YbbK (DUF523 family)|nr:DUF523 domain-containing protein [Bacilli bacterium]
MMEKILISACLVGINCRYDGKSKVNNDVEALRKYFDFILICPEVDGGLPTPRAPSERKGTKVINSLKEDNTLFFSKGARRALQLAQDNNIRFAILKSKSPSCGSKLIYDGTFSRTLVSGNGVTTDLLLAHGIEVFSEDQIEDLLCKIQLSEK